MAKVRGEEGSVTLAAMRAYDNAAGPDIDAEEPINGGRLACWEAPAEVGGGTGREGRPQGRKLIVLMHSVEEAQSKGSAFRAEWTKWSYWYQAKTAKSRW